MSENETDKPVSLEFVVRRLDSVNNNVNDMCRSVIALQSRFDGMEARFGALEARFASMETRFAGVEAGLERQAETARGQVEANHRIEQMLADIAKNLPK
jgi:hypothetical protein